MEYQLALTGWRRRMAAHLDEVAQAADIISQKSEVSDDYVSGIFDTVEMLDTILVNWEATDRGIATPKQPVPEILKLVRDIVKYEQETTKEIVAR
jgi:hypothetical protein